MLSREYFELIHSEPNRDNTWQVYRPRDKILVLFSADATPLASVAFRCQTTLTQTDSTRGRTVITERPDSSSKELSKFQGLVDTDNQEIELVITNLSTDGFINFNILRTDKAVTTVNPGGLNEVNELRANESYAVKCDQQNNLSLILSTCKDLAGNNISVKSDEETEKTVGTYFYLSVVPQLTNAELCKRFESTVWKCVDLIVRQVDTPVTKRKMIASRYSSVESHPILLDSIRPDPALERCRSSRSCAKAKSCARPMKNSLKSSSIPKSKSQSASVVMESSAAAIKYGRCIEVNSSETGIEYNYDVAARCMLGLSVSSGIKFFPEEDVTEMIAEARRIIGSIESAQYADFLAGTIYNSDECCICLEAEPNVVFFQCGHRAIHNTCMSADLKLCPLCRAKISACLTLDSTETVA